MKSICLLGLVLCAACGSASAVGNSAPAKSEVARSAGAPDTAKTGDQPAPASKDGGSGGW